MQFGISFYNVLKMKFKERKEVARFVPGRCGYKESLNVIKNIFKFKLKHFSSKCF